MTTPDHRYYILEVQAAGERAPHIRSILAAHLRHWGLEPHIGPVCRGVQELFRNVAEHAGPDTACTVELRFNGRLLTAAVSDHASGLPRPLGPGRGGLATVAALSDTWGACPTGDGKIVWFTRRAVREPAHRPAPALPDAVRTPDGVPG